MFYLSGGGEWNPLNSTSLPAMGCNGIATALLANSNPIGTIFSSLVISHISVGGAYLPTKYFPSEIADLISGIIIYQMCIRDRLDNIQSMICTFCLAADAPHSLYWHVEVRGSAKRKNKMEE